MQTRRKMAELSVENLLLGLRGEPLRHIGNLNAPDVELAHGVGVQGVQLVGTIHRDDSDPVRFPLEQDRVVCVAHAISV